MYLLKFDDVGCPNRRRGIYRKFLTCLPANTAIYRLVDSFHPEDFGDEIVIKEYMPSFYSNTKIFLVESNGVVRFSRFYFADVAGHPPFLIDGRDEVIRRLDRLGKLSFGPSSSSTETAEERCERESKITEFLAFGLNTIRSDYELRQVLAITPSDIQEPHFDEIDFSNSTVKTEILKSHFTWWLQKNAMVYVDIEDPDFKETYDIGAIITENNKIAAKIYRISITNLGKPDAEDDRVSRIRLAPLADSRDRKQPKTNLAPPEHFFERCLEVTPVSTRTLTDPATMTAEEACLRIEAGQPIVNATVLGDINISNITSLPSIHLHNVKLHGNLIADHTRIQGELRLHFVEIDGILSTRETVIDGVLTIRKTKVKRLTVSIQGRKRPTVVWDDIKVRGAIECVDFEVTGDLNADGIEVNGNVIIADLNVHQSDYNNGTIDHPPSLDAPRGRGNFSIRNSKIYGDFRFFATKRPGMMPIFKGPGQREAPQPDADGMTEHHHVSHCLFAHEIEVHGDAHFTGVDIAGDLTLTGAKINGSLLIRAREIYKSSHADHPATIDLEYGEGPIIDAWPTIIHGTVDISHAKISAVDVRASNISREVRMIGTKLGRIYMLPAPVVEKNQSGAKHLRLKPTRIGSLFGQSIRIAGNANFSGLLVDGGPLTETGETKDINQTGVGDTETLNSSAHFNAGSFTLTPAEIGGDLRFWRYQIIEYALGSNRTLEQLGRVSSSDSNAAASESSKINWLEKPEPNAFHVRTQIVGNLDLSNVEVKGLLNLNNIIVNGQIRLNDAHIHADILCESLSRNFYQDTVFRPSERGTQRAHKSLRLLSDCLSPYPEELSSPGAPKSTSLLKTNVKHIKVPKIGFQGVTTPRNDDEEDSDVNSHDVRLTSHCRRFECESLRCDGDAFFSGLRVGMQVPHSAPINQEEIMRAVRSSGFYRPEFDGRKMQIEGELRFAFGILDLANVVDIKALNTEIDKYNAEIDKQNNDSTEPGTGSDKTVAKIGRIDQSCRDLKNSTDRLHLEVAGKLDLSGASAATLIVSGDSFSTPKSDHRDSLYETEDSIDLSRSKFHVVSIRKNKDGEFPNRLRLDDVETDRWEIEGGISSDFLKRCEYDRQMLKRMRDYFKNISDDRSVLEIQKFSSSRQSSGSPTLKALLNRNLSLFNGEIVFDNDISGIILRLIVFISVFIKSFFYIIIITLYFIIHKIFSAIDKLFSWLNFISMSYSRSGRYPARFLVLIGIIWVSGFFLFIPHKHIEQTPQSLMVNGRLDDKKNPTDDQWGLSDAAWMASRHAIPLLNIHETRWEWGPSSHPIHALSSWNIFTDDCSTSETDQTAIERRLTYSTTNSRSLGAPNTDVPACHVTVEDVAYGLTFFAWIIWSIFLIQVTGFFRSPLD